MSDVEIQKYQAALKADPKSRAFAPLAEIYRKVGKLNEALQLCSVGLSHNPDFSGARLLLAQVHLAMGDNNNAEKELMILLRQIPNHLPAHQLLAHLYVKLGRQPHAQAIAQRLIRLKPDDPLAKQILSGQSPTGASPAATAPKSSAAPTVTLTTAKLFEQQGHLLKALEIVRQLVKQQPGLNTEVSRLERRIGNQRKVAVLNRMLENVKQQTAARR